MIWKHKEIIQDRPHEAYLCQGVAVQKQGSEIDQGKREQDRQ